MFASARGGERTLDLEAETAELRDAWVNAIRKLLSAVPAVRFVKYCLSDGLCVNEHARAFAGMREGEVERFVVIAHDINTNANTNFQGFCSKPWPQRE